MIGIKVTPIVHEKIIKEALSRIGVGNKKEQILYPSCYLTVIDGDYVVAHFKELFPLISNGVDDTTEEDIFRRDTIVTLLEAWDLLEPEEDFQERHRYVFVLKKADRPDWTITHKINLKTLNQVEADNN